MNILIAEEIIIPLRNYFWSQYFLPRENFSNSSIRFFQPYFRDPLTLGVEWEYTERKDFYMDHFHIISLSCRWIHYRQTQNNQFDGVIWPWGLARSTDWMTAKLKLQTKDSIEPSSWNMHNFMSACAHECVFVHKSCLVNVMHFAINVSFDRTLMHTRQNIMTCRVSPVPTERKRDWQDQ